MLSIDLNCDLGESFGAYTIGMDAEILPYVTSANIACGFHAGDPSVMQKSVLLCKKYGVQVGAHPGLPDLQGFGRRRMAISPAEAEADVMYQIGALKAFCDAAGVPLHHVKPHGALYNMAARDPVLAAADGPRVATLEIGGWDTHTAQNARLAQMLKAWVAVWIGNFAGALFVVSGDTLRKVIVSPPSASTTWAL